MSLRWHDHSDMRQASGSLVKRLQLAGILALASAIPALLSSVQLFARQRDAGIEARWFPLFLLQIPPWLLWALFSPFIVWLARRYPLTRERWHRSLGPLLGTGLGIVLVYEAVLVVFLILAEGRPLTGANYAAGFLGALSIRLTVDFLLYWAILGAGHALWFYRRYRDGELRASQIETDLVRSRLANLQHQLHPHFLFNALHTVAGLVRHGRRDEAVRLITNISDLLRYSLDRVPDHTVPLDRDLELLERYLEIEETRFRDRLRVERNVEAAALDAHVPSFLLQPLVENALRHGIGRKPSAGVLSIHANVNGDRLRLTVRDDGPGLPDDHNGVREGVGLGNLRERMDYLYGNRASMTLRNDPDGGAVVTVELPYSTKPPLR